MEYTYIKDYRVIGTIFVFVLNDNNNSKEIFELNSIIKKFKIIGLFGYQTFESDFSDDISIFIGENGMGKTTVMSILFYLLKADFLELLHYDFDSISIVYTDDQSFNFKYN